MRKKTEEKIPNILHRMLRNCDTEDRWHWHRVEESKYDAYAPSYSITDETITVYIPLEYLGMTTPRIRSMLEHIVKCAYEGTPAVGIPRVCVRYMSTQGYKNARREIIKEELHLRARKVPEEFNDAMALHPGLRKNLNGMMFLYCETDEDGLIARSDHLSNTIIISEEVFRHEDRLLRTYVVFRELAVCQCIHPFGPYNFVPNPDEMMRFLNRYPNWKAYERKCAELGWKFRYPIGDIDEKQM